MTTSYDGEGGVVEVLSYCAYLRDWRVKTATGHEIHMDLMVSGGLPEGTKCQSLVGAKVRIDYAHPCHWLAEGVELIEEDS